MQADKGRTGTNPRRKDVASETGTTSSLPPGALRWRCPAADLPFESTAEVKPVTGVVGQDAAVQALRYGLETNAQGQNIFVRGLSGTGRLTLVRRLLEGIRRTCRETKDCCYVHNFSQPERPRLISLPPGKAQEFRRRVDKLADFVRDSLGAALSSQGVNVRREVIDQQTQKQLAAVVQPFEGALKGAGLTLVTVEVGPVVQTVIFPLVEGRAAAPEELDQLHAQGQIPDADYKAVRDSLGEFERQLVDVSNTANEIRRKHDEAVSALLGASSRSMLEKIIRSVRASFPQSSVQTFLNELVDDVVTNRLDQLDDEGDFTRLYRVNVVSEHKGDDRCPMIVEDVPTVRNLVGSVDHGSDTGDDVRPSHMGIRAGSLLRADGGYLILENREVLGEPEAWKVLKRVLRTGRLEITPPEATFAGATPIVKPEPIEVRVRVVMLGDPEMYYLLDDRDPDFPQLFKVLADFDDVIPRDKAGANHYAGVLARIAQEEGLAPFDRAAVAAIVEHGARIAGKTGKLTARFGQIADVAREAAFIAARDGTTGGTTLVTGDHIRETVRRRKQRADLPSRRFRELVTDGTIRVNTRGTVVGQINGLAVLQAGPIIYGFPTRITATIGPGTAGVINIDREAALSGAIHTKGFYILRGLLRFLLRTDHPLAFDASLAFEQSYGEIDGDSASGAEMSCLLSALTDVPLRQDMAMTGAIDQMGNILAVGAVNEKIEGFFDACHDLRMTGTQGVIIPKANAGDLMLRQDVVDACAAGEFQVYAVDTLHEALKILTSMPAGTRSRGGGYPEGTLLAIAVERAREYWEKGVRPAAAAHAEPAAKEPLPKPAPPKAAKPTAPKRPSVPKKKPTSKKKAPPKKKTTTTKRPTSKKKKKIRRSR